MATAPRPTEAVIFDFYGTLVRLVDPLPPSHASVFHRLGLDAHVEAWGDQWATGPADGEDHRVHSVGEREYLAWEVDRLRRRALECGVPEAAAGPLAAELDRANKALHLELFEDVKAVGGPGGGHGPPGARRGHRELDRGRAGARGGGRKGV
ncbi:hypothetical protein AB0J49_20515, partial [Streptomyces sp. NPDC049906]